MNYKIVKITSYYRDFLNHYYDNYPQIVNDSYNSQYNHLMAQAFGWSDFYCKNLRAIEVDAYEIVSNAKPMQRAWALENNVNANNEDNIVLEQLKKIQPDVVFLQDVLRSANLIEKLKSNLPSVKLNIGWYCSPFTNENLAAFKKLDFLFVCSPYFQNLLGSKGIKTYLLSHAFENSLLPSLSENNNYPWTDFIFIGSLIAGSDFHNSRIKILDTLLDSGINAEIYANISYIKPFDLFLRRAAYSCKVLFNKIGLNYLNTTLPVMRKVSHLNDMPKNINKNSPILKIYKEPIYGLEMLKALSHSKISFNKHGDSAGDFMANIRIFECTGAGSCLVTDWKKGISDFFEIDKEIVTYKSTEECIEKIKWLLANPVEREKIAKAGQLKTLTLHNYANRAVTLDGIIRKELK